MDFKYRKLQPIVAEIRFSIDRQGFGPVFTKNGLNVGQKPSRIVRLRFHPARKCEIFSHYSALVSPKILLQ